MATPVPPPVCSGYIRLKDRSGFFRTRSTFFCQLRGRSLFLYRHEKHAVVPPGAPGAVMPLEVYEILDIQQLHGKKYGLILVCIEKSNKAEKELELDVDDEQTRNAWMESIHSQLALYASNSNSRPLLGPDNMPPPQELPEVEVAEIQVRGLGLDNREGENNCFLNVIVQSLWHLESFRTLLLNTEISNKRTKETSVIIELQELLRQYQDARTHTLNPFSLRKGLSELYKKEQKFQLGAMADAEETLITLLQLLHAETASFDSKDGSFDPDSISHAVFNYQMHSRTRCGSCSSESPWELYSDMVFSTYASEITLRRWDCLEKILKEFNIQQPLRSCPEADKTKCIGKAATEFAIQRFPLVFTLSIIWVSDRAPSSDISAVLNLCKPELRLDVLTLRGDALREATALGSSVPVYQLRGLVCYYGKHYFAYFLSKQGIWTLFDDKTVKPVGDWKEVATKVARGRYQPVLLFYELPPRKHEERARDYVRSRASSMQRMVTGHPSHPSPSTPHSASSLRKEDHFNPANILNYPLHQHSGRWDYKSRERDLGYSGAVTDQAEREEAESVEALKPRVEALRKKIRAASSPYQGPSPPLSSPLFAAPPLPAPTEVADAPRSSHLFGVPPVEGHQEAAKEESDRDALTSRERKLSARGRMLLGMGLVDTPRLRRSSQSSNGSAGHGGVAGERLRADLEAANAGLRTPPFSSLPPPAPPPPLPASSTEGQTGSKVQLNGSAVEVAVPLSAENGLRRLSSSSSLSTSSLVSSPPLSSPPLQAPSLPSPPLSSPPPSSSLTAKYSFSSGQSEYYEVTFTDPGSLGIQLDNTKYGLLYVKAFPRDPQTGARYQAEKLYGHVISLADFVTSVNSIPTAYYPVDKAVALISAQGRPITLRFKRNSVLLQHIESYPQLSPEMVTAVYLQYDGDIRMLNMGLQAALQRQI